MAARQWICAVVSALWVAVGTHWAAASWAGDQLVSELVLTDGLTILNLFTISADGQELRITTTLRSSATRVPVTIRRFYRKYEDPPSEFHCIETLSMKRVCSTSEIAP